MTDNWSIYQRKNGRWVAERQVEGGSRPKRQYLYATTREEVERKVNRRAAGSAFEGDTLAEWLDHWLDLYVRHSLSPSTYSSYESTIRVQIKPALGNTDLDSLSESHCLTVINRLMREGKGRTAQVVREVLKQALDKAVEQQLLTTNPATNIRKPKIEEREMTALTQEQVLKLKAATLDDPLHALYMMAITMGLRSGELRGLRWKDINLRTRRLTVNKQLQSVEGVLVLTEPKTKASKTSLPIPMQAFGPLFDRHVYCDSTGKASPDDYVFTYEGKPIDDRRLRRMFKKVLEEADLPDVRVHDLRHTCATLLVRKNVPMKTVQGMLRHSSYRTTADLYAHVQPDMLDDAAALMDEVFA